MATGRLPDPNTAPLTAKGDLYTYSTVPARLAVGSNGDTLVADSSNTTGLRYNPPVGSLANPVINGGMDIWQRGTSVSVAASLASVYTSDRWALNTNANQASTVSRQSVSDSTNLPNIQYCARVQRNASQTGTLQMFFGSNFEIANSVPLAGKTITISFYARAGANYSPTSSALNVYLFTGTGSSEHNRLSAGPYTGDAIPINNQSVTLTTTWQRFALTATLGTGVTQMCFAFAPTPTGTAGANDWFEVTGVQFDVGTWTASTAPTFRRSGGTLAGELAACQRYYYRQGGDDAYQIYGVGIFDATTSAKILINFPVTMRVAPTAVDFSTIQMSDLYAASSTATGLTIDKAAKTATSINLTGGSGMTQGRTAFARSNNSTSAFIGFSAEL